MRFLFCLFGIFFIAACQSESDSGQESSTEVSCSPNEFTEPATYSADVSGIISAQCLNCHQSGSGRSLATYQDTMSYVHPGSLSGSRLYNLVSTGAMPPMSTLTSAELELIQNWILNCAPEN